ncbi:MAG: peptide chain release factor N(5)-glutamine methyltransferase [Clostridia bacterium]|nr:peptide chain release factor N(5)-glutamine methyltransferase [Clostridia bacterium]
MTFYELISRLEAAGVENASFEAEIIAEIFCGLTRAEIPFSRDKELSGDGLADALRRRESGEPLQYIAGEWEFMNEVYEVTPAVLIPRQDTETLVEWAIKNAPQDSLFADLGTGSGCIAISLLAARRDLRGVALDVSAEALEVAKRNAEKNGVADRISFVRGDILSEEGFSGEYDLILSNPPYVSAEEYGKLDRELYFEPKCALTDGGDGLSFYRAIVGSFPKNLKDGGAFAFEIGASQAKGVSSVAEGAGFDTEILKDLAGRDRAAILKKR